MNQEKTEAKKAIDQSVVDAWRTWVLSAKDMQEILISIAGDIAVSEGDYIENVDEVDRSKRPDFVSMVNSLANMLIDASSKGYVSGDDLDYANICLRSVIPYLTSINRHRR